MHSFIYREFMLAREAEQRRRAERDRRVHAAIGRRPRAYRPDPAQDVPPLAARENKEY